MELLISKPVNTDSVKTLREETQCGLVMARVALESRMGNLEFAKEYVTRTGLAANMSFQARYPKWYEYINKHYALWWVTEEELHSVNLQELPRYMEIQAEVYLRRKAPTPRIMRHDLMPHIDWDMLVPLLNKSLYSKLCTINHSISSRIAIVFTKVNLDYLKDLPGYISDLELNRYPWVQNT